MPPCSLISSTRSIMPKRTCLPKPAIGPDRSWIVPMTISSFVMPCTFWAWAAPKAATSVRAAAARNVILRVMACLLSGVHRFDAVGVLLLDELALQLHRRRELLVLGGQ